MSKAEPQVQVELASRRPSSVSGLWLMAWRVQNVGASPLELLATWLPHGLFRSARRELAPTLDLPPGQSAQIELPVACRETPGTVVENAFVILSARWQGAPWRIFARLRVTIDQSGAPHPTTEVVTTQPVGFSR